MRRWFTYTGAAMLALALAVAVLPQTTAADAIREAGPAAISLGFRLTDLPAPTESGSDLWGTRSFRWEFVGADRVRNLLAYLVVDDTLCLTSVRGDSATDHGCVVVDKDRS